MPSSLSIHPLPSRVCGPLCGLCGFAVAMFSGLLSSGEAASVLARAMVCCLVCYGLGVAVGYVFELVSNRVVDRERGLRGVAERGPEAANKKTSVQDS